MQLFARTLQNGVVPVTLEAAPSLAELKCAIQGVCGIPPRLQRLRCGVRDVREDRDVSALPSGATVFVLLRLRGGKGGFGSLLRVQGRDTKATTNFEACRDLSGRRLRYVNAEKKMEEWKKNSKDRELETIALKHVKEIAMQQKREKRKAIDPEEVSEMQRETVSNVKKAVQSGLQTSGGRTEHRTKKPRFAFPEDSDGSGGEEEEGPLECDPSLSAVEPETEGKESEESGQTESTISKES